MARCEIKSSGRPVCARCKRFCSRTDIVSRLGPAQRIAIVGGSIAGLTAARELRACGFEGTLTVVDRDPSSPYRRPDVSKRLLFEELHDRTRLAWPNELRVDLVAPGEVVSLDLSSRAVTVDARSGSTILPFDGLVIATGSRARRLPFDADINNVHWLRTAGDAAKLRSALAECRRLCVIGGGLIGLEVAALAASHGKQVMVVEAAPLPMVSALGPEPAAAHMQLLEARGVQFRLGANVSGLLDSGGGAAMVRLASGEDIVADVVLVAVGAAPETGWLRGNGLDLTDGVLCDEHCAVIGADDVVACGDVARWFNPLLGQRMRVEHWTNAIEQGQHAARRVLGLHASTGFSSLPYFWSDQADLKLQMVGSGAGHDEVVILERGVKRLVVEYRSQRGLLAVLGVNAGAAAMSRRPEIVRTYVERSASVTAMA
jgi:NADPH-dependent 2,4-dienoyl-CoA reductase/sulfur reductase-like enzyme